MAIKAENISIRRKYLSNDQYKTTAEICILIFIECSPCPIFEGFTIQITLLRV